MKPLSASKRAEAYYDSPDADHYFRIVWGGEDIHLGIYETPGISIADASRLTVGVMAACLELEPGMLLLDIGSGYGGPARFLAQQFGLQCHCLNASKVQNQRNAELTREAGLSHLVDVEHGYFEAIPHGRATFDLVWCEDALIESSDRVKVLEEVFRVLRGGGTFIFSDIMEADDACPETLRAFYEKIKLRDAGSVAFYSEALLNIGFEDVCFEDLTMHAVRHYAALLDEIDARYEELIKLISLEYLEATVADLEQWHSAAESGQLCWGIFRARRPLDLCSTEYF